MTTTKTPMGGRPNRYPGTCRLCGTTVAAGAGALGKDGDAWIVSHLYGDCPTIAEAVPATTPIAATGFTPTAEQVACLALYASGDSMVIEAGAGTGKTSTLRLLAASDPTKRVQYLAFNKAIVVDVSGSMPTNVQARTVHSLAFAAVGRQYAGRIKNSARMTSQQIARTLIIDPIYVGDGEARRALQPGFLAGHVMRALGQFCRTADPEPTVKHFAAIDAVDGLDSLGARTYDGSNMIARTLLPALKRAWTDIQSTTGTLPFKHDHYLKIWQLSHPVINADVIMFDEAQDANPLMADVVARQTHAQRVYVGDSAQAIYEFTGAVNALADMKGEGLQVATLSQSFRFGPAIAARANDFLDTLDADIRLTGLDTVASILGPIADPDAILTRTNACAVEAILTAKQNGVTAHLVGKGTETLRFAEAVEELQATGTTGYPDLACFTSWEEVQRYAQEDALGEDLALNVRLVEKYTTTTIISALRYMPDEADATLIVSTAHKAKGREWDRVEIAQDFAPKPGKDGEAPKEPSQSEIRLRYVAVTRAKLALDASALDDPEKAA